MIKLILFILYLVQLSLQAFQDHLVTGLNNITGYDKPWYSGYFRFTEDQTNVSYAFYPSQDTTTPSKDQPLVLWFAGGPGCSAVGGSMMLNGPFIFKRNSSEATLNPYSYNKVAHVLYIDTYPSTGFSRSNQYRWNDETNAQLNKNCILEFYKLYPEYQNNELYLTGVSYSGVYLPHLAEEINFHNQHKKNQKNHTNIPLKGLLIGNGCTSPLECYGDYANPFVISTLDGMGFLDAEMRETFVKECGDLYEPDMQKLNQQSCLRTFNFLLWKLSVQTNLNLYNPLGTCWHPGTDCKYPSGNLQQQQQEEEDKPSSLYIQQQQEEEEKFQMWYKSIQLQQDEQEEEEFKQRRILQQDIQLENPYGLPCLEAYGQYTFMNSIEVKKAMHMNPYDHWVPCDQYNVRHFEFSKFNTFYMYHSLIKGGLRIWHESGNIDAAVPTASTLYWIDLLNKQEGYEEIVPWRAWYTEGVQYGYQPGNRQNAGQFWRTKGITFASVKGGTHAPSATQPAADFHVFSSFLKNQDLPEL